MASYPNVQEPNELLESDLLSEITEQNEHTPKFVNEALMNQTFQHVNTLYEKYGHDEFMTSKIYHYISQQLPTVLLNTYETRQKSQQQKEQNEDVQRKFIQCFLNQGKYFYHPPNECFYIYDKMHYRETSEDDVLYDILSTITRTENRIVQNWKHKTKISMMKRIKQCHLFKTIPESDTIQHVLGFLYPTIFREKDEAKYFLVILGDNLLRKNTEHIHFVPQHTKPFLKELNRLSYLLLSQNCTQTFKMKCHEKHYENVRMLQLCRIVPIVEGSVQTDTLWRDTLAKYALDVFCVACHYSNRYNGSDQYLVQHNNNTSLVKYVHRLCDNNLTSLFEHFCTDYLYICSNGRETDEKDNISQDSNLFWEYSPQESFLSNIVQGDSQQIEITWKNMFYLWKDFLRIQKYPQNLYYNDCKTHAIEHFKDRYDDSRDSFRRIGSSQLPIVQKFLRFWDETIREDDSHDDCVLELDEISMLFRKWLAQPHNSSSSVQKHVLNESKILDILSYYKAHIEIEDRKFIYRYKCLLWDKEMEIDQAIERMKRNYRINEIDSDSNSNSNIYPSIIDAYVFYSNEKIRTEQNPLIVSKLFFEQYVKNNYADFIMEDMFTETFLYQ
jgi:hypothetical protein